MSNIKLFESKKVRTHWDEEKEQWFFSVIDVIEILTESPRPRKYWNALTHIAHYKGGDVECCRA